MDIEICIDSVEGARAASDYNAKRVELCAALSEGGLTPSLGLIEACVEATSAEVFVMIRPSAGGFNYTDAELRLMERDIRAASHVGADGVVFGVLNERNEVAVKANAFLIETALELNLGTTFHRAIDLTPAPLDALNDIIHLGFDRILSSGSQTTAPEGLEILEKLAIKGKDKIEIMAGCGIRPSNVAQFIGKGLAAVHFTAKKYVHEDLKLDMGSKNGVDRSKIEEIVKSLK